MPLLIVLETQESSLQTIISEAADISSTLIQADAAPT